MVDEPPTNTIARLVVSNANKIRMYSPELVRTSTTDELDECILTLFHKVILPGREGALSELLSHISI